MTWFHKNLVDDFLRLQVKLDQVKGTNEEIFKRYYDLQDKISEKYKVWRDLQQRKLEILSEFDRKHGAKYGFRYSQYSYEEREARDRYRKEDRNEITRQQEPLADEIERLNKFGRSNNINAGGQLLHVLKPLADEIVSIFKYSEKEEKVAVHEITEIEEDVKKILINRKGGEKKSMVLAIQKEKSNREGERRNRRRFR